MSSIRKSCTGARPYSLDMVRPGDEVYNAMLFMFVEIFVFCFLAYYLQSVLPNEFGLRKPWYFIFTEPFAGLSSRRRAKRNGGIDPKSEAALAHQITINEDELQYEDADGTYETLGDDRRRRRNFQSVPC